MCRRFTMLTWGETNSVARCLEAGVPLDLLVDWPARRVDALPDAKASVIVAGGCAQSCRTCPFPCGGSQPLLRGMLDVKTLQWGYRLPSNGKLAFNTRIEHAGESPLWSESFAKRRCVVPVASFFETSRSEKAISPTGRQTKQVYRFGCSGVTSDESVEAREAAGEPFTTVRPILLGGIWQEDRFSIVTTEPNEAVRPVHDRMPLALSSQGALAWLAGSAEVEQIAAACMRSEPLYPAMPNQEQLTLF